MTPVQEEAELEYALRGKAWKVYWYLLKTGQLSIPGYSSYLYPLDANHLIGLGKENETVKLSLFDVTNVNAPVEIARYVVNASYSDSQALQIPKAFLYDAATQTLVIPISIMSSQNIITPMPAMEPANGGVSTGVVTIAPTPAGFWQGVFIFNVSSTSGFTLRGNVTQIDNSTLSDNSFYSGVDWINRAAYTGNTLYTFSDSKVQLNNIDTLAFIAEIDLN